MEASFVPIASIRALGKWSMMHYLKEADIPYSRLHDVGGRLGGPCDIACIYDARCREGIFSPLFNYNPK